MSMNKWCGIGRATRDPQISYTAGDNPMCTARFSLAVERDFKKDGQPNADFITCVAFAKQGEFAEKFIKKGQLVGVEGRIQTGSYENKDGQRVYTTDVIVEKFTFCEKKGAVSDTSDSDENEGGFVQIPDDSDLPFK